MTAPDEDRRREDFIRETAKAMREAEIISLSNRDEVTDWLRTVWHEARGEEWGEDATQKTPLHLPELATCCICELRFVKETMKETVDGRFVCQGCYKPHKVEDRMCEECLVPLGPKEPAYTVDFRGEIQEVCGKCCFAEDTPST